MVLSQVKWAFCEGYVPVIFLKLFVSLIFSCFFLSLDRLLACGFYPLCVQVTLILQGDFDGVGVSDLV